MPNWAWVNEPLAVWGEVMCGTLTVRDRSNSMRITRSGDDWRQPGPRALIR
ncbi:hypothetical protein JCM13580A_12170 [Streptomyces drozdowiczii]